MKTAPAASRAVWWWCLVYTSAAAPADRRRRREELNEHLWESRQAGQPTWAVLRAAARGAGADVTWSAGSMLAGLGRLSAAPMTWVGLAMVFPLMGWWGSASAGATGTNVFESAGGIGGPPALLVAAALALRQRRRRDSDRDRDR